MRKLDVSTKASRAYREYLDGKHDAFLRNAAQALGRPIDARFRYTLTTNGMALDLTPTEAEAIQGLAGVTGVRPEQHYHADTDASAAWMGAEAIWNGSLPGIAATRGEGVIVGVLDTGINSAHPSFADIGADGYNHANPRGQVYGVCGTQPARCNDKLIGIYDFVGDGDHTGTDRDGHGSHTASTAAGNVVGASLTGPTTTLGLQLSGVAPHANIIAYKVLDDEGRGTESSAIAGMEQAAADQVDVINMSFGAGNSDPWDGLRSIALDYGTALLNARFSGVVPVASAGNDGPGASTVRSPSTLPWVISVAAASHNRVFEARVEDVTGNGIGTALTFRGAAITAGLPKARIVHGKDFGSALCGRGASQDTPTGASNPFPVGTFHGEIVVCDRGTYGRVEKGFNVKQSGAGGMILANSAAEGESIVADGHHLPAVHIGFADGTRLRQLLDTALAAGGEIRGALSGVDRRLDAGAGDVLADFSSRGPVDPYGSWLKPNITAPGRDVIAAIDEGASFAIFSGTSMASPNVAGTAALLLAAHPTWSVAQVESALLTTGIADVRDFDLTAATAHEAGIGRA
ncbi:MAG TPA: S8 family serine peptidase, partial [Dongiaceae bacterium]|nr:S8 family serine peptidase [Dongiaceae bacterium]